MNMKSNLAYDNSRSAVSYPVQSPYTSPNVRVKVSQNKQKATQKRANALGVLKVLLVVCCAFLVLYRGVMITDRSNAVNQKKASLEALVTSNEKLQFEIDRSLDLDNVEAIARDELGMRRAEKYQTVYLDLEQADYVEKVAKNQFSPASRIAEFFSGMVAYLD